MSIRTTLALFGAVALAGCGSVTSNPDGNDDTDNGCEPNCGTDTFAASIAAEVGWTTGDFTLDRDVVDGCEGTSSCAATVDRADLYEVDFENTHGFVTKLVDVNDEGTFNVTWDEPGDWSVKASGLYENQWGEEIEVLVNEYDFDGNGDDERVIDGDGWKCNCLFDQTDFEGTCNPGAGELTVYGWVDTDGTLHYIEPASDGDEDEWILTMIEPYPEE